MQFRLKVTLDINVEIWMGIGLETKIESDGEIEAEMEVGIESKVHKKGIMKIIKNIFFICFSTKFVKASFEH